VGKGREEAGHYNPGVERAGEEGVGGA
jgi:hypothetical protein